MESCFPYYEKYTTHCIRCSKCDNKLDCDPCDPQDREMGKNCIPILECGDSIDSTLPEELSTDEPPVPLASVKINTKCLCKPCVKIEYSSIITSASTGGNASVELTFRLVRECEDGQVDELKVWQYIQDFTSAMERSKESFTVTFCECLDSLEEDCCEYTIELIEVVTLRATYDISDRDISAFAACNSPC